MAEIARTPTSPPARAPQDARYYDERDLEGELRRTFQICHECRMCVSYCGSFPELFDRVDRDVDAGRSEGAETLSAEDFQAVSDQCWQCKLCYIKCPYTADEGASELLDFPRLMLREKANRAQRNGVPFVDRLLGEPQLIGAIGAGRTAELSNLIQSSRLLRKVQEKATGISAEFPLPPMATQTFAQWMRQHEPEDQAGELGEVVLFATCYGNYNTPQVARAAVRVLEHWGYRVRTVDETCCGMPNLDGGDVKQATAKMVANVAVLLPLVRQGLTVLVPASTCGYTMKKEWPEYLDTPEAKEVADATLDLMQFLEQERRRRHPPRDFAEGLGKVVYHAPCHLRAQKIGFPAARLLGKLLPDTEVEIVQQCSAVDGTWGMKQAHYETGRRYAKKLINETQEAKGEVVLSDCGLSALRMTKETGQPVLHPVEALARAYGLHTE